MSATGKCQTRRDGASPGCRPRSAGFTLIELLVVLAILVMAATAFPVALNRALPGRRVHAAAQQLISTVRALETSSIGTNQPVRRELEQLTASLPSSTRVTMTDPDGATLDSFAAFPDGSTTGARFEIIDGVHRSALLVSELTGRAVLEDQEPK
jgi:general secretion pathway protein H